MDDEEKPGSPFLPPLFFLVGNVMKRSILGCVPLFALFLTGHVLALEVWVIGNEERPWADMGTLEAVELRGNMLQPREISINENLATGVKARGGGIDSPQPTVRAQGDLSQMIDGDRGTAFEGGRIPLVRGDIILDLGAIFAGVSRIRFYPRQGFEDRFLRSYELYINTGGPERDWAGNLIWDLIDQRTNNVESDVKIEIPAQDVRYLLLRYTTSLTWEIAELEVYGEGYVREGTYTSNVIDFGEVANFSNLRWSAEVHPGASMALVTRSGDTPEPYKYYRKKLRGLRGGGYEIVKEEVTKAEFGKLDEDDRIREVDAAHWSAWSAPYSMSQGESIGSPSPRRYFQFKIDFLSTSFESGVRVDWVGFDVSRPPIAHEIVAEISPKVVRAGDITSFTYAVRPKIEGRDTGFDALEVITPFRVATIRDLNIGGVPVGGFSQQVEDTRFVLFFPDHRVTKDGTLLTFTFDCRVVAYGTRFGGTAFDNSKTDELPQTVIPGNATLELDTDDLSVAVKLETVVVDIVDIFPNPFTPNGDGQNDEAVITYRLLKLWMTSVSPSVSIYGLSGALVRVLRVGERGIGVYEVAWDGRDAEGALVPAGMYLCRISAPMQAGQDSDTRMVGVIY